MIARMDQLTVIGRRSIARELLQSLQSLGVVQIDPLEPAEGLELVKLRLEGGDKREEERWSAVVGRCEALLAALPAGEAAAAPRSEIPAALDDLEAYLKEVGGRVDALLAERTQVRDELDLIRTYLPLYRSLAPLLAQLEGSRYLHARAFLVSADAAEEVKGAISDALDGRVAFDGRPYGRESVIIAVVLRGDAERLAQAFSQAGVSALALPARYAQYGTAKAVHVMEERSQALPRRARAVDEELAQLAASHGPRLQAVLQLALNQQSRYQHMEDMLAGRYAFALRGWVPSSDARKVVDGLRKQFGDDVIVASRPADEHHDHGVPVKLENPGWVRPFEMLLSLFAPPRYGNFDPSWTLAVFFPLFFGIVVGDIGFGLLFLALGLWLRARGRAGRRLSLGPLGIVIPAKSLRPIGTIVNWAAFWSILWGFVYGEFFGNLLEHWPHDNPIFYPPTHAEAHGLIPITLFRVEQFTPLLLITIGFGILQVLGGWAIRTIYGFRHGDRKHIFEGLGMLGGISALVVFAYAYLTQALATGVWVAVGLGFALFLVGVVLSGIPLMLVELISNSGNILSYLRLFAVGLSAALVANLATDLGFAIAEAVAVPVLGTLLGLIIGLTVHLLAIALTIIGHALQPLRLQYVEFFTKFGFYEENGRPYKPFRLHGGKA